MSNWSEHIKNWKGSGQSRKAYCKEQGLKYDNFLYHLRKTEKSQEVSNFIALPSQAISGSYRIDLPNGIRITCEQTLDGEVLKLLRDA